ncbi:MAG: hypothetical protein JWN17_66 [Frankiales bacterium]|nr:hypothetical protein [Frankiales bacterium]
MSPVARVLLVLVRSYRRWVSPLTPPHCRFAPSCSTYALEALQVHGAGRGSWLSLRRLARCHPFHPGGHDPVPPARERPTRRSTTRRGRASATMDPHRPALHPPAPLRTSRSSPGG